MRKLLHSELKLLSLNRECAPRRDARVSIVLFDSTDLDETDLEYQALLSADSTIRQGRQVLTALLNNIKADVHQI